MSVTERLMGLGEWNLTLKQGTSFEVLRRLDPRSGGHVVIFPAAVDVKSMNDSQALTQARFSGLYNDQPSLLEIGGPTANFWAGGQSDTRGRSIGSHATPGTGTFLDWRTNLAPPGLTLGITPVTAVSGTFVKVHLRTTYRAMIDDVSNRFEVEWRVTPDFKFDWAKPQDIFDLTPKAVIVRKRDDSGRDFGVLGITGEMEYSRSAEDYVYRVLYWYNNNANSVARDGGVADIDKPFRAPDGTHAWIDLIIEDSQTTAAGDANALGDMQFKRFYPLEQKVSLSSIEYDIGRDVQVGDALWVFDDVLGLVDITNKVRYRGRTIHPMVIRCVGQTWPIRQGMGVWLRRYVPSSPPGSWLVEWTDLTPYVEFETGETTVEVGAKPKK